MELSFSTEASTELKKIKHKHPQLFNNIQKKLKLFRENIKHPSLRTHKLKGKLANTFSISIEGNYRMVYTVKNSEAIFFKMGTHEQVYRK